MIIYTKNNIINYYFSVSCDVRYRNDRIVICKNDNSGEFIIKGNPYIIKKIYENLSFGCGKEVLINLLKQIAAEDVFNQLEGGKYIE